MRRKIYLLLIISLCTNIGSGIITSWNDREGPEQTDDAFL